MLPGASGTSDASTLLRDLDTWDALVGTNPVPRCGIESVARFAPRVPGTAEKLCTSRLAGDVRRRDHTLRSEAHQQLARHGISAAELPGSVGAHVPAADRRGEAQQLLEVLAQRDVATGVDERIWGDCLVEDHRRERVSAKVPALEFTDP